jgi:glycogen debranching enzyme
LQPLLHDLVPTVAAPTSVLAGADGQIRPSGVQGAFHADARVLSQALLRLDGREPEGIGHAPEGTGTTRFVTVARWLGDRINDPTVRVDRYRHVAPGQVQERIEITSTATVGVAALVTLDLEVDLAPIEVVRSGRGGEPLPAAAGTNGVLSWTGDRITVTVTAEGAETGEPGRLAWKVHLNPRERAVLRWDLRVDDPGAVTHAPRGTREWSRPDVTTEDARLSRLVERSLDDLDALRLSDDGDTFLAAGVPWYLTLFGRDSIWAARMLLPLGTDLAAGTLRVLARRQGTKLDPETGEAPGKIMHELRRHTFGLPGQGIRLPPVYYGTVDATLLWISLLHDAWRWGMPAGDVAALLPPAEAALGWLSGYADPDGDGFVEYVDETGRGLANQGWKDSADAVRFADGRRAVPPIALAEVQGYAYRAALDGAALLDAFGRDGGDRWRQYAAVLAERFRSRFWVDGGYPALALDGGKQPVDSLTSNIGHLLGTGMLNADEERAVAGALASDAMSGGYGLRTMSARDAGFSPLSYHCGSIWIHDTAIVAAGLARSGFATEARTLIDGLLAAAEAFDYRMPELYAGDARVHLTRPMPYPAACRPQAWSAASAILIMQAVLGLEPDVPAGRVRLSPLPGMPLEARGLRIAGRPVDVRVDAAGVARIEEGRSRGSETAFRDLGVVVGSKADVIRMRATTTPRSRRRAGDG